MSASHRRRTATAESVLASVVARGDWCSSADVRADVGCAPDTAVRALNALVDSGHVVDNGMLRKGRRYRLGASDGPLPTPAPSGPPSQRAGLLAALVELGPGWHGTGAVARAAAGSSAHVGHALREMRGEGLVRHNGKGGAHSRWCALGLDPPPTGRPATDAVRGALRRLGPGWHTAGTVAGEAGVARGSVRVELSHLTALGEVVHNGGRARSSRYRLAGPAPEPVRAPEPKPTPAPVARVNGTDAPRLADAVVSALVGEPVGVREVTRRLDCEPGAVEAALTRLVAERRVRRLRNASRDYDAERVLYETIERNS